jgi:hypothetical protein
MSRFLKQFMYLVGFFLVLGVIGAGVYFLFLKPSPSCFDHTQNQGEEGIDCEGPCVAVCIYKIEALQIIGGVRTFPIDANHLTLLAQIQNPNENYISENFAYDFILEDGAGNALKRVSGESYIYSREVKYLVAVNVSLPSGVRAARLEIKSPLWSKSRQVNPALRVQSQEIAQENGHWRVDGKIVNDDTLSMPEVLVISLLKNNANEAIGVSQTKLENVAPDESRSFGISYPPSLRDSVSKVEVVGYALRP